MKTKLSVLILGACLVLGGCSNAAKEADKAKQDSIAESARAQARIDSMAAVAKGINDSLIANGKPPLSDAEMQQRMHMNDVTLQTTTPTNRKMKKSGEVKFRVKEVRSATERIENLVNGFGGYVTLSSLNNRVINQVRKDLTNATYLYSREIEVVNSISLKLPVEKLDSFLRALNPIIDFLDYRNYAVDDVTAVHSQNSRQVNRIEHFDKRQTAHIDQRSSKLKETTHAENDLLDKQLYADALKTQNEELDYQINYCTFKIEIYQKSFIVRDVYDDFNDYSKYKPNLFTRVGDSLVTGWVVLEAIIVFLFKLWGILLLLFGVYIVYRVFNKPRSEK